MKREPTVHRVAGGEHQVGNAVASCRVVELLQHTTCAVGRPQAMQTVQLRHGIAVLITSLS